MSEKLERLAWELAGDILDAVSDQSRQTLAGTLESFAQLIIAECKAAPPVTVKAPFVDLAGIAPDFPGAQWKEERRNLDAPDPPPLCYCPEACEVHPPGGEP